MRGVAALALLLVTVHLGRPCEKVEQVLFCLKIPSYFDPGCSSLLMVLKNVGEVNSTVFQSDNLASIISLIINNANITRIAEKGFGSFPQLTSLSLTGNMLSQVNTSWFRNPAVLRELNVADNRIAEVTESTLKGLSNLTKLRLNKNRIKAIRPSSFRSQSALAEVDLSENRLTWVPPQIFTSLGSLRSIRLDGNPWNCSCVHRDFVASVKELQSRSQLDRGVDVTCDTPPPLKGQPVWNVSVCPTSPSPPTNGPTAAPTPTANVVTTHQSRLTSEAETSFHLKAPSTVSSPTESPTGTKPTDMTPALKTGTFVTSPASGTRTSAHLRPPNTSVTVSKTTGVTESVPTQPSDTNITCTLIAVIAVLCVLLFVVCFLAALHRRKQSSKAVMPACVKEEKRREPEEDDRSSHQQCPGRSELDLKRAFRGVRAKSANAVILTSPFGVSKKDEVTFQTETEIQLEVSEKPGEGKQKPVAESEVAAAGGGIQMDGDTTTDTMKECERQDDDDAGNLDQNPECIYVNTDLVPYLSIGTSQNKDEESTKGPNQRSQMGKVMGRVSTWPPTAAQWQARCKVKEEEEGLAVWTKNETVKLSDEVEKVLSKRRHPSGSDLHNEEEETSAPLNLRHCLPSQPNEDTHVLGSTSEEQLKKDGILDAAAKTRNQIAQTQELKSAEDPAHKSRSKTEARKGQKQSATGRQKAGNRTAGSKAPSGGTSPDDETLLSGNEYAFMDLLQEVAQNNGRWTRDRWKQVHANKQRR